ncbi:ATP-binding protein [Streptomyces sp. NPDC002851]
MGHARAALRKVLLDWGLASVEETSVLVLSELLTNAVRHARVPGREIETRYLRLRQGVRIEVHDAAYERPVPVKADWDDCSGRGLVLVGAVADRWGVSEWNGPGKAVWAECSERADGTGNASYQDT